MSQIIQTLIIEQSALIREGLVHILAKTRYRVSGVCSDIGQIGHNDLNAEQTLVLLGLEMEMGDDLTKLRRFKERFRCTKVVVLSAHSSPNDLLSAVDAGADCLLSKQVSRDALFKALDLVLAGEMILPRSCLCLLSSRKNEGVSELSTENAAHEIPALEHEHADVRHEHVQSLSRKETEILRCLTRGASNKLIARELCVAEATVKVHIKGILRKIRVQNRTQAAIWALKTNGLDHAEEDAILG